jgi:hypothetical protein
MYGVLWLCQVDDVNTKFLCAELRALGWKVGKVRKFRALRWEVGKVRK